MTGFSERLGKATALLGFRYGATYLTLTSIIAYCQISKLHAYKHLVMSMNHLLSHVLIFAPVPHTHNSPATTNLRGDTAMDNAMYYWRPICMQLCPEPCKLHVTAVNYATTRIVSAAYRLACATLHQDQEILRPLEENPYIDGKRTGVHQGCGFNKQGHSRCRY
jgi:hypothetical protein